MNRRSGTTSGRQKKGGEHPYRGWAWRGADLDDRQLKLFTPGRIVKHVGVGCLRTGPATDWPVLYLVHLHLGWHRGEEVALPSDTCFEVKAEFTLPGGRTILALEQVGEGWKDHPGFMAHLKQKIGDIRPDLPRPKEEEQREWSAPFACWLPGSSAGDPPAVGPIYEFEEAVRFASSWSGVDEMVTWEILAARHRYLELAGIAQVEEDEALVAERKRAMTWLPEHPGRLDGREEGYVAWVTGYDRADIQAVDRGEMAYLDHMDLVIWDYEGEREERIGLPSWPNLGINVQTRWVVQSV